MDKDYDTLIDMMMRLIGDAYRCYQDLETAEKSGTEEEKHFRRRTYTRAVFAAIEGACECFRKEAFVAECNKVPKHVHLGKLSVLAGETYYVTEDGDIRMKRLRIGFLNHVLLSLKSYAETQGVTYRTKKGDQWHRIQNAVKVRDRITHPKKLSGLAITKEEVADIDFSLYWFLRELGSILREKGCELPPLPAQLWID
jgi:hypothetical protein